MLHGNFEQLASLSRCSSSTEYFQLRFVKDLEVLFNIVPKSKRPTAMLSAGLNYPA